MSNLENNEDQLNNAVDNSLETTNLDTSSAEEQQPVVEATADEQPANKNYSQLSRQELLDGLRELLIDPVIENIKTPVELIKQAFYRQKEGENSIIEEGAELVDKITDKLEEEFKELLAKYKDMKAAANALLAEQQEKNLVLKREILAKLEKLSLSEDDLSTKIPAFRKLQQEWKAVKEVPATAVNEIWKAYNKYQEKFYDLIKLNNEFREYDFKKNLELKNSLIAAAEKLEEEPNAVLAFNTLQKLHEEWREIGPVAKDEREAIWNRFKEASTKINKKHQAYFEQLKAKEEENLRQKTALCEKVEAIDIASIASRRQWEDKSAEISAIQEEWRGIGYATKKHNTKIYRRFREACDKFYKTKNSYYKSLKEEMTQNLQKKRQLIEEMEAL